MEAKEITEKVDNRLREISARVKIPGFRPGKAPIKLLKQRYGPSVMGEVLERAVTDSSAQALNERGLRPAMLKFSGRKTPDGLHVHGFITVSGEKMSKSRGTGISPLRYLEIGMNAEWMRYYIAAKLNSHVEDLDFNPDEIGRAHV